MKIKENGNKYTIKGLNYLELLYLMEAIGAMPPRDVPEWSSINNYAEGLVNETWAKLADKLETFIRKLS